MEVDSVYSSIENAKWHVSVFTLSPYLRQLDQIGIKMKIDHTV